MNKRTCKGYVAKQGNKWAGWLVSKTDDVYETFYHVSMKSAMANCAKAAKALDWQIDEPFERVEHGFKVGERNPL